jgi:hypothetical protein
MDEFAELEVELFGNEKSSVPSLQHILILLDSGELEVDFIIESVDEELTSSQKWGWLALGVVLTPLIIGFMLLWVLIASGTLKNINSTTHTLKGKYYLRFFHSIFEYEYVDGRLTEAKLTTLNDNSYVDHTWVSFGDNGGQYLAFYIHGSGNDNVRLGDVPETITRRKENFQKVYQKVKDFCEISGLKNVSSLKKDKKYAQWINEMS